MPISTCHPQTCPRLPLTPNPDVPMSLFVSMPVAVLWQTSHTRSAGSPGTSPWWWVLG